MRCNKYQINVCCVFLFLKENTSLLVFYPSFKASFRNVWCGNQDCVIKLFSPRKQFFPPPWIFMFIYKHLNTETAKNCFHEKMSLIDSRCDAKKPTWFPSYWHNLLIQNNLHLILPGNITHDAWKRPGKIA